jgi:Ca2+-binding RTX toxin-like protein
LLGDAGDDQLFGGEGADVLVGGEGVDQLTGGAGIDEFVFLAGETGVDTVTDFDTGDDFINLESLLSGVFDAEIPQEEIRLIEGALPSDSILQVNTGTHAAPLWADVAVLEDVGFSDTINIIYDQQHEAISFANTPV